MPRNKLKVHLSAVRDLLLDLAETPGAETVGVDYIDQYSGKEERASFFAHEPPHVLDVPGRVVRAVIHGRFDLRHPNGEDDTLTDAVNRTREAAQKPHFRANTLEPGALRREEDGTYSGEIWLETGEDYGPADTSEADRLNKWLDDRPAT